MIYNNDTDTFELEKRDYRDIVLLAFIWPFALIYNFIKFLIKKIRKEI